MSFIETVLLALPEFEDEDDLTLDVIKPYWTCLEELVDSEAVLSLGIADLNKSLLEQLYNWARVNMFYHLVGLIPRKHYRNTYITWFGEIFSVKRGHCSQQNITEQLVDWVRVNISLH